MKELFQKASESDKCDPVISVFKRRRSILRGDEWQCVFYWNNFLDLNIHHRLQLPLLCKVFIIGYCSLIRSFLPDLPVALRGSALQFH